MTIIWHDGFSKIGSRKNFMAWSQPSAPGYQVGANFAGFHQLPDYSHPSTVGAELYPYEAYNAPKSNNDLIELVDAGTRAGMFEYACRCMIKNSVNGDPIDDKDGNSTNSRRTELTSQATASAYHDAIPLHSTRWLSQSFYVPSNWQFTNSSDYWGPGFMQIKPANDDVYGPTYGIGLEGNSWRISLVAAEQTSQEFADEVQNEPLEWMHTTQYTADFDDTGNHYPNSGTTSNPGAAFWAQGAIDWVDEETGPDILRNLNKGGWTDFVTKYHFDPRGPAAGGVGRIEVWKRSDNDLGGADGGWHKIFDIQPMANVDKGGQGQYVWNRGSCFNTGPNVPGADYVNGGFGYKLGLYTEIENAWNADENMEMYCANFKIGDENSVFSELSPDGTFPTGQS